MLIIFVSIFTYWTLHAVLPLKLVNSQILFSTRPIVGHWHREQQKKLLFVSTVKRINTLKKRRHK